jgi:toxin ParE1/3/4
VEINWTDPALDDLDAIFEYVGGNAPAYANHFIQQIMLAADRLERFPHSGRRVPEAEDDLREVIFQSYRIIYWIVDEQRIDIVGVVHGSRDLSDPDIQPWNERL